MPDIIQHLQEYLGTKLSRIDPTTEKVDKAFQQRHERLAQAAVPAVLAVFYKFSRSAEGADYLATDTSVSLARLMNNKEELLAARIAEYAGVDTSTASDLIYELTSETSRYYQQQLQPAGDAEKLQVFFGSQREAILNKLPPDLQLGELMNDNTLDDKTNKMTGPASGLAHSIENIFSSTGAPKEE